ncbi:MAG: class I SAM-dependent methyltransferase [Egibacteraceae bacterium]
MGGASNTKLYLRDRKALARALNVPTGLLYRAVWGSTQEEPTNSCLLEVPRMRDYLASPRIPLNIDAALELMRPITGWFTDEEATLLLLTASWALCDLPDEPAVVEIGSYCGRSTVLLASAIRALRPAGQVVAIDPHDGVISLAGRPDQRGSPTYEAFLRNLTAAGMREAVQVVRERSTNVSWRQPIGLLLIDALHDYDSVRADFQHFAPWITGGGYVAFHDHSANFPGVIQLIDEVRHTLKYGWGDHAGDLVVLQKQQPRLAQPAR